MGYAVGLLVALLVAVFGRIAGFDRDRAFYSTILVVVALYYVLFAAMGGSTRALVLESIGMAAFAGLAVAGFRHSSWIVATGLAAHGVFDFFHAGIIDNPGVPAWWPAFCMTYDLAAAALLAAVARSAWTQPTGR